MKNEFRVTSHAESYMNPALHNRPVRKGLCEPYAVDGVEQAVENGVIVKRSVLSMFDPADNMRGYKATDFALENIIAAGAMDMLRESRLSVGSLGELSDGMEGTVDAVIAAVDASENNVENVGE